MIRTYTRIVGVVLVSLGLAGLAGIVGVAVAASFFHAAVGGIFVYLGFWQRDAAVVRQVVGGMGVLLLVVKSVTIFSPSLLGESPLHGPVEITCLIVGFLSILAARYLREDQSSANL